MSKNPLKDLTMKIEEAIIQTTQHMNTCSYVHI